LEEQKFLHTFHSYGYELKDSLIKTPPWPISLQRPPVMVSCVGMKFLLAGQKGAYNSKVLTDLMVINEYCDTSAEMLNQVGSYQR